MEMTTKTETKFSYQEYFDLVKKLVAEKSTTGADQSDEIIYYTGLNLVRMERINRVFSFTNELLAAIGNLKGNYRFVVLTEAWCGDAAQTVPVFSHISKASEGKIELELLLRDENLMLMDQYLTNGGRSIPKLIVYNELGEVKATWGPRPEPLSLYMQQLKEENKDIDYPALAEKVQLWYAKDRTQSAQKELTLLIESLK